MWQQHCPRLGHSPCPLRLPLLHAVTGDDTMNCDVRAELPDDGQCAEPAAVPCQGGAAAGSQGQRRARRWTRARASPQGGI